ncbi:35738_t:CDS:2, partial [Racocetra persica]
SQTRILKYQFPLARVQRGTDAGNTYIINPIQKNFNIKAIILQVETSCELPISQAQVPNNNRNVFVQFNTGFFWFITALDINESLRYLKYMFNLDERSRYNLDTVFAPGHKAIYLKDLIQLNNTDKPNLIPIPPPKDNDRQPPTITINTPTTTIN